MGDETSDRVELLGIDDNDVPRPRSSLLRVAPIALVAVVLGLGLLNLASGETVEPVPTTSVPPGPAPDQSTVLLGDTGSSDLLVSATPSGLVIVSTEHGRFAAINLASPPLQIADAGGSRLYVYNGDEEVLIVETTTGESELFATSINAFVPSATPGRVWLRSSEQPDEIVEVDADNTVFDSIRRLDQPSDDPRLWMDAVGALHQLDSSADPMRIGPPHHVLDTTDASVYAEDCEARTCHIMRRSLRDPETGWEPIGPSPPVTSNASVSYDDHWLTITDDLVIALYRTDIGGIRKSFTKSSTATFSRDSSALYVIDDATIQVVDLVGTDTRRVPLPSLADSTGNWVALSPE